MKSLWERIGESDTVAIHYQCSIEPDNCYKWMGWKAVFDAIELELREQIAKEQQDFAYYVMASEMTESCKVEHIGLVNSLLDIARGKK